MINRKEIRFDNVDTIREYLKIRHLFRADAERGDYRAIDIELEFDRVFSKVNTITDKQKMCMNLTLVDGMTQREVSEMYGISQQSVQKRVFYALNHLVEAFKKDYFMREKKTRST